MTKQTTQTIIGVPKEIKQGEKRVGMKPSKKGAAELSRKGFSVLVEKSAGQGSGFKDKQYIDSGAKIAAAHKVWTEADLIVKVKEPLPEEFRYFRSGLFIFCFFHLAPNRNLVNALIRSGVTAIAYETVGLDGLTPILKSMSNIAGRVGCEEGKRILMENKGILLGSHANVMILGLGNAGLAAAKQILNPLNPEGVPANLFAVDSNPEKLENFRKIFHPHFDYTKIQCIQYNPRAISSILPRIDLLIGTTHIPGQLQQKLITKKMIQSMTPGSVVVDISIDQGGCFETSMPTSIAVRTFEKYGVTHYCVPNMPGIVPRESTNALTAETFSYIAELSANGFLRAVRENSALAAGVNVYNGKITHKGLADSIGAKYSPLEQLI
ncbi:MAG: hypothetical protein A3B96_02795 [Candidatus Spechtbacteria bacterium RIFCSPHIGHO2_02_FULL_43_15b]|nr:MAG: hypothetical protein A3B96_02795 [Candidatus Spechtbacteria bacterium RIFCSPHIGHO2_02_FULL_43_15b]